MSEGKMSRMPRTGVLIIKSFLFLIIAQRRRQAEKDDGLHRDRSANFVAQRRQLWYNRGTRVSYNGYYVSFPRMRRGFDSLHPHHGYDFGDLSSKSPVFCGKKEPTISDKPIIVCSINCNLYN